MTTTPLRGVAVATLAGLGLSSLVALAAPAQAASAFQITKVKFDSTGTDTPVTNKKLNDEYVVITNTGTVTRKIGGWRLRDVANHVYVFPAGATLGPKKSVRVRTGRGTDTATDRYQNRRAYVWNNTSDTAWLRDANAAAATRARGRRATPATSRSADSGGSGARQGEVLPGEVVRELPGRVVLRGQRLEGLELRVHPAHPVARGGEDLAPVRASLEG